jgi:hypothetical protein
MKRNNKILNCISLSVKKKNASSATLCRGDGSEPVREMATPLYISGPLCALCAPQNKRWCVAPWRLHAVRSGSIQPPIRAAAATTTTTAAAAATVDGSGIKLTRSCWRSCRPCVVCSGCVVDVGVLLCWLLPVHSVFLTLSVSDAFCGARAARSTRHWDPAASARAPPRGESLGPAGVLGGPRALSPSFYLAYAGERERATCDEGEKGRGALSLRPCVWHFGRWFCVARSLALLPVDVC